MFKLSCKFFGRTSKESEPVDSCCDACCVDEKSGRLAIADGVTSSFYSNMFSALLVEKFCENPYTKDNWQERLSIIQAAWRTAVIERVNRIKDEKNPIWTTNWVRLYDKNDSAASTFLGLEIVGKAMHITVLGDSCLFIWRNSELVESLPYKYSSEFVLSTECFESHSIRDGFIPTFCSKPILPFAKEDVMYCVLATDALSQWILERIEKNEEVLSVLLEIKAPADFQKFVDNERKKNAFTLQDDVSLIVAELKAADSDVIINSNNNEELVTENVVNKNVFEQSMDAGHDENSRDQICDGSENTIKSSENDVSELPRSDCGAPANNGSVDVANKCCLLTKVKEIAYICFFGGFLAGFFFNHSFQILKNILQ